MFEKLVLAFFERFTVKIGTIDSKFVVRDLRFEGSFFMGFPFRPWLILRQLGDIDVGWRPSFSDLFDVVIDRLLSQFNGGGGARCVRESARSA